MKKSYYKPVPRRAVVPLTEEQRDLAETYLPLARKLAKPLKSMFPNWSDEFDSVANLALVEAARNYESSRGKFSTFAYFRIRGALADVGRAMGLNGWEDDRENAPNVVTLTPYNEEHGRVLVAHEPTGPHVETDDIDSFERMVRRLPANERRMVTLYYLHGKCMEEIGREMGRSQSDVTRLHKSAIHLLSPGYHEDGRPFVPCPPTRRHRKTRAELATASA